ncbi:DUF7373 family lipoprotein [Rhodococcus phenolicus]|uniref:DUF7373 family lipoprotein n=1 Tax=Rhodococcus phenolicus TaxID=263849 RepID=UPI00083123B7|nr:hypothetical protein [Rhodococcus phenolicus]
MRTSRILTAAVAAAALSLAGCSSNVEGTAVDNTAASADAGDAGAESQGDFDIDTLDTGGYNTVPKDFEAEGQLAADFGPAVEGQRIAEFVIAPYTVDPKLVSGGGMNQGVGVGGLAKLGLMSDAVSAIAEKHQIVNTFSDFQNYADDSHEFGIAVVRLADNESAVAIADELHAAELTVADEDDIFGSGAGTPVELPGLSATHASTYRWETGTDTLSSYTVSGPHVIYTYASTSAGDPEWAKDITTRALQKQIPMLDGFPYTPTPEIPKLVIDMDKVLARAVGYTDDETARNSELAVYGPLGWLHFDSDPEKTAELFEETGTDRVAMANTTVYRTASPEDAETVRDAFVAQSVKNSPELTEDAAAPQNVPGTTCLSGDIAEGRMSVCYMTYGPYLAEIHGYRPIGNTDPESDTLRTMSQRVATQYVKFVEAEEMGLGRN